MCLRVFKDFLGPLKVGDSFEGKIVALCFIKGTRGFFGKFYPWESFSKEGLGDWRKTLFWEDKKGGV